MKASKQKILVFERMSETEHKLDCYLAENFKDAEFKFIFRVDQAKQEEIVAGLMWCDMIAFQSIFETNFEDGTQSFRKMIDLFWAKPEFRKPVHIIHSTNRLLEFLNIKLQSEPYSKVAVMLENGLEVYNVYHETYADPTDDGKGMFKKPNIYKFAAVKLWNCKEHKSIWDEHPHYLPKLNTTHNLYKYLPKFVEPKKAAENKYSKMTKTDLDIMKEILEEDYQRLTELIEDLETYQCDPKEKKELLASHQRRLKMLDKLGITSFR